MLEGLQQQDWAWQPASTQLAAILRTVPSSSVEMLPPLRHAQEWLDVVSSGQAGAIGRGGRGPGGAAGGYDSGELDYSGECESWPGGSRLSTRLSARKRGGMLAASMGAGLLRGRAAQLVSHAATCLFTSLFSR